ncbi:hypothetical protein LVB87_14555 [Lysobacter sp. KIS68-7]|uniref:hypothetical protein n=1 Tax=Lysobacter sp. KIS68-7 TaxID=2904252 RepID=UPI001E47C363|nr:hypothetical protein [Lysobacter sp. KIS68-7]UHQ19389.1 hypothetical protein LVB87_14555 [Lysobacter sp. KIS68-7]
MMFVFAGLAAGFLHVLSGPDHLAAIAPYAVEAKGRAWRTGVRWGFGHAAGVLCVGLVLLLLRDAFPIQVVSALGERTVGLVLIGIGAWGLRSALARIRRGHDVASRHHGHEAFAVGTVHGVGGSAHLLGIVPALALPSNVAAGAYLALFGIACVAAMGTFATLIGWGAGRRQLASPRVQGALLGVPSVAAVAIGFYWLFAGA